MGYEGLDVEFCGVESELSVWSGLPVSLVSKIGINCRWESGIMGSDTMPSPPTSHLFL